jgi:2-(1,2-epoxy-1,2-dihydrophenyl)acetyl-CoA isomerase
VAANGQPEARAGNGGGGAATMIGYALDGPIAVITLNRPEARNAQNDAFLLALDEAWMRAAEDEEARVIVLRAEGPHFSAGHDLKSYHRDAYGGDGTEPGKDLSRAYRWEAERFFNACRRWSDVPKPSIAAVHGACIGAGLMLCWPCDLIVAAEDARFIEVFVRRGIAVDAGGAFLLMRRIGMAKAKELVFLGDDLPAREAERIGLINRCVPPAELERVSRELAERLAQGPTFAIGMSKRLLNRSLESDLDTAFSEEAFAQSMVSQSQDIKEGMRAFMEKRPPQFKGR